MISAQETRRLFGLLYRPDSNTNVRHCAILRKALELCSVEELAAIFEQLTKLRVVMGSASTYYQLGKIQTHYVYNGSLVSRESPVPAAEARQALLAYRDAYDAYFMKKGNLYLVRDAGARLALQAAEQAWHDWIVPYLAARGRPGRPDWALEPLPGLQRVRAAAALAPRAPTQLAHPRRAALPSPPPTSPVRGLRPTVPPSPIQPTRRHCAEVDLLTPPPSSPLRGHTGRRSPAPIPGGSRSHPIHLADDVAVHPPKKRKFLGVIDISDVIDDEGSPRKKRKFLGVVDLTV